MKTECRSRPRVATGEWVAALTLAASGMGSAPGERTEVFRTDPGWDGYRNHLVPLLAPVTRQDFGHRAFNRTGGKEPGEIGGRIQRSAPPAWYAKVIPTRTLEDRLEASGTFAVAIIRRVVARNLQQRCITVRRQRRRKLRGGRARLRRPDSGACPCERAAGLPEALSSTGTRDARASSAAALEQLWESCRRHHYGGPPRDSRSRAGTADHARKTAMNNSRTTCRELSARCSSRL
jgi:hypothetical protein